MGQVLVFEGPRRITFTDEGPYSSRVVAVGFYQGEATGLALGEEYHHNRISLVCSQISGVNPALQVTHVPFSEAAAAFELLDTRPESVMQAVLSFGGAP